MPLRYLIGDTAVDATDRLLDTIYDATFAPDNWPTALAMLAAAIGSVGAHIVLMEKDAAATNGMRPRMKVTGSRIMDPAITDRYMSEWHVHDPLIPATDPRAAPSGRILQCHEALSNDFVARNMSYQDFLIPSGGRYQAGVVLENDRDWLTVLDIHSRDAPFERQQLAAWAPLFGHVRRAIRLSAAFAEQLAREALLWQTIDRNGLVCFIVDSLGRVVDQSRAGAEMLARGDIRVDVQRRILLKDETKTGQLRVLITDACRGLGGGEIPFMVDGYLPAAMRAVPAGEACCKLLNMPRSGCAMLYIEPLRPRHAVDDRTILATLGCSPAEAEVAAALAGGLSPGTIAAERGTSIHTVRAQIRNLLDATGTHRIGALVSRVHRDLTQDTTTLGPLRVKSRDNSQF